MPPLLRGPSASRVRYAPRSLETRSVGSGISWSDVVELRAYHTDPNAPIEAFAKLKHRCIKAAHSVWSAIGTSALRQPGTLGETTVIAHVPKKRIRDKARFS